MCVTVDVHAPHVPFWTCGRAERGAFPTGPSPTALLKLIQHLGLVGPPDDEEHMVKAKRRERRTRPFCLLTVYGENGELMTFVWCRSASATIKPLPLTQNKPDVFLRGISFHGFHFYGL